MIIRTFAVMLAIALTAPVAAQQEEGPWSGKATLGYLATSGNTENSNLNSGFEITYAPNSWTHRLRALAINAAENEVTTAEAYELGWKSELALSEANYIFARVVWRKDRFSSYDQQLSESIGYGRRVIDTDRHKLNAEIGAGARQSDLVDGTTENEVILRAGLDYLWAFSETAQFSQDIGVEAGDTNTYIESITALKSQLLGQLALVASYTVKHNTEVVAGTEKTDTFTALSLEYAF